MSAVTPTAIQFAVPTLPVAKVTKPGWREALYLTFKEEVL